MLNVWMLESSEVLWYYRSSSDMASFKPTKVQFLPKLGETVTEETLYWKKYKVWDVLDTFSKVYVQRKVYVCVLISHHFLQVFSIHIHCFVVQSPVQIKEFGAITKIDFSPLPPSQLCRHRLHQSEFDSFSFVLIYSFISFSLLFKVTYRAYIHFLNGVSLYQFFI